MVDLEVGTVDALLHLALFVVGGAGLGVAVVALIERVGSGSNKVVRPRYVVIVAGLFVALLVAERTYHLMSSH